jgi:hypothetical protein
VSILYLVRKTEHQAIQQDRLMLRRAGHATTADFYALFSRRHYDVDQTDLAQFIKHVSLFVPQPCFLRHFLHRFPEYVGEEADQNMRLDAVLLLIPDRSNAEIAFVDSERGFGLGQLDVRLPKILRRPVDDVRPQQLAAFVKAGSLAPRVVFRPRVSARSSTSLTSTSYKPTARLF